MRKNLLKKLEQLKRFHRIVSKTKKTTILNFLFQEEIWNDLFSIRFSTHHFSNAGCFTDLPILQRFNPARKRKGGIFLLFWNWVQIAFFKTKIQKTGRKALLTQVNILVTCDAESGGCTLVVFSANCTFHKLKNLLDGKRNMNCINLPSFHFALRVTSFTLFLPVSASD